MPVEAKAASPFRFAPIPVLVLALIIYAAVAASVLSFDEAANVPKDLEGLNLDRGYEALSKISLGPHPFMSHANDDVRSYLLSRLQPLADRHDHVHLSDDHTSNVTYVVTSEHPDHAVYFEGLNVLLKIDGTDSNESSHGVLFSGHFDTVSTAPGATDDGMAVVSMLELAQYFSAPERRPRRTAIFHWNNGEEDSLNGAHAFFQHPWSNLTSTFINLEGAAAGGRPVVFRSTSLGAARSLLHSAVKQSHGNILTSEAFSLGLIRSATDYEVYAKGGLQGFDFAFYKNRAYYHTPRDSIAGMGHAEGRRALWAMLELTRGAALSLLNGDEPGTDSRRSVYFDVLGRAMMVFPLDAYYVFNGILLGIGPATVVGLLAWLMFQRQSAPQSGPVTGDRNLATKLKSALVALAGWERFWIALFVSVLAHVGLIAGFIRLNPYVIHSHSYVVLATFLSLSFLALVVPLQALHYVLPPTFVSQKLAVTLSIHSCTWLLLLASTVAMGSHQISSLYWATILYLGSWLAAVLELVRAGRRGDPGNELGSISELFSTREEREARAEGPVAGRRLVRGVRYEAPGQADSRDEVQNATEDAGSGEGEVFETDATEITPLVHQHRRVSQGGTEYLTIDGPDDVAVVGKPADEHGWWIAQMLLLVPAPALLLFQLQVLVLNALMHTLVDGSNPLLVYGILSALSVLIFIPLAPFAHKLPHSLNAVVGAVFLLLLVVSWTLSPFNHQWPSRVYFQQSVELAPASGLAVNPSLVLRDHPLRVVRAETTLTALQGYVDQYITPAIPSSWSSDVTCDEEGLRDDLMTCKWPTDLLPAPTGDASFPPSQWLDVKTARLNTTRALVSVRGENTRGCRLYLDRRISFLYVHNERGLSEIEAPTSFDRMDIQVGHEMPAGGVNQVRLWSRTWGKEFVVEVGWDAAGDEEQEQEGSVLRGRAACEYVEYASALGPAGSGRIPAFEEVKHFMPLWTLPTKLADGLSEVWTRFEV